MSLEALEDRAVPASFTVTSLADNLNAGTLRSAITAANASPDDSSSISFQAGLNGTISLTSQLPTLTKNIVVDGLGSAVNTISGNGTGANPYCLFQVAAGTTCTISDLALTGGETNAGTDGGAIANSGTLTLLADEFLHNYAGGSGGAVSNIAGATLYVSATSMHDNTSGHEGGAVLNKGTAFICCASKLSFNIASTGDGGAVASLGSGSSLSVTDSSQIYHNTASRKGGGILSEGTVSISDSSLFSNLAMTQGGGIYVGFGSVTMTNVSITNNQTGTGGGFYVWGGSISFTGCTLSGNSAWAKANTNGGAYNTFAGGTYTWSGGSLNDPINPS